MINIEKIEAINFLPEEGKRYKIETEKDFKENYAPFGMIGPYKRNNARKQYMDIFDLLLSLPKSTALLFNEIKENSDKDLGIAVMTMFEDYPKSKMGTTYRRLAKLREINLVKKVVPIELPQDQLSGFKPNSITPEKYSYMINPYQLKPWKYELAKEIWERIN